jgi:hypothetical protein
MNRHVRVHDLFRLTDRNDLDIANHTSNGAGRELGSLIQRRERSHKLDA